MYIHKIHTLTYCVKTLSLAVCTSRWPTKPCKAVLTAGNLGRMSSTDQRPVHVHRIMTHPYVGFLVGGVYIYAHTYVCMYIKDKYGVQVPIKQNEGHVGWRWKN